MVDAHAAAVDAFIQGVPFGYVVTAAVPALDPFHIYLAAAAAPGWCAAAVGLVGVVLGEVVRQDHPATRGWALVAGQGAVAAGDDVFVDEVGAFDAVGQGLRVGGCRSWGRAGVADWKMADVLLAVVVAPPLKMRSWWAEADRRPARPTNVCAQHLTGT